MTPTAPKEPGVLEDVMISTLYSLEDISDRYYLTSLNLVYNAWAKRYCAINLILQNGYPYVTMQIKTGPWRKVTMHKLIALARINNGPYELIEHLDDNPMNLRVSNLKFSTYEDNAASVWKNHKRHCPCRIFEVEMMDGRKFTGTMVELAKETGISRITLYDRFYKGPIETDKPMDELIRRRMFVKSVTLVEEAPPLEHWGNRSIDYRKGKFRGEIVFDNYVLDVE